ncbi:MAG: Qat anti-phage system associated protein QatB [Vicinamibacterales bacterium]
MSPAGPLPAVPVPPGGAPPVAPPGDVPTTPPDQAPTQVEGDANRFRGPRASFSKFAKSGGSNGGRLGRAVSRYVSHSSGGARRAAQKMGSSRTSAGRLLGFLADAQARGSREALRALNLEGLAGRPIEEIFLGLMEYVCPKGGNVDEGIARDAFIETIADLADIGVTDLDQLTADQTQTVLELYATHAIEDRLCNEIGTKAISLPQDVKAIESTMDQLRDFVRRSVSDSIQRARAALATLTVDRVQGVVDSVYETAFSFLQAAGELVAEDA